MTEENIYRSVPEPWEDGPTPGDRMMDPIKPTDGPWELYRPPNGQLWIVAGRKPNGVHNCLATVWTPEGDEGIKIVREANGRLMVASKELLETCKTTKILILMNAREKSGVLESWTDEAIELLNGVITKATWEPREPREP